LTQEVYVAMESGSASAKNQQKGLKDQYIHKNEVRKLQTLSAAL